MPHPLPTQLTSSCIRGNAERSKGKGVHTLAHAQPSCYANFILRSVSRLGDSVRCAKFLSCTFVPRADETKAERIDSCPHKRRVPEAGDAATTANVLKITKQNKAILEDN